MADMVFLFPGQGSQYQGMGEDLYKNFKSVRELFERASDELRMDMLGLCFTSPEDVLKQTVNVQPAMTLVNAACLTVLREEGIDPSAAAGHSLGEYAALYAAGACGFSDLMGLVRDRGAFMHEAAEAAPGGMLAVMGLDDAVIGEICAVASAEGSIEVANHNSPAQVILTGEEAALKKAAELAKARKAKLTVPLKVSGPWHSRFMAPARERMAGVINSKPFKRAGVPVVANATAEYEMGPDEIRTNLINQITSPVLWSASMQRLLRDGHRVYVEAGPKKVLKGLMKDIDKDAVVHNVDSTESLKSVLALVRP